jgi:hypothetical protein
VICKVISATFLGGNPEQQILDTRQVHSGMTKRFAITSIVKGDVVSSLKTGFGVAGPIR